MLPTTCTTQYYYAKFDADGFNSVQENPNAKIFAMAC